MGKKKKEKIIYVDDGRTVADMSNVSGTRLSRDAWRTNSTGKEKWQTYWMAVRMMILPMLVVLGILGLTYLIMLSKFDNLVAITFAWTVTQNRLPTVIHTISFQLNLFLLLLYL